MTADTSDFLLERGRPDDVAVVDGGRSYTYAELRAAVDRLAAELAGLDLPPGSRVGIVGANSFFWVAAYLAALKGHVAVPFSDKIGVEEMARQSAFVGCAAVLLDRRHQRRFGPAFPEALPVVTDAALSSPGAPYRPETVTGPDDDAVLLFTSGTTAAAKAVRITHRNIAANTGSIVSYLGLRADDRMLVVLPFFYCFGLSLLHTHLRVGGSLVLCNSFVFPEVALDLMDQERCTGFAGVPSSYQLLLRASSFASRELPTLRLLQQAGGKLSPVLVEELVAAKPRAQLFVMYGQTEATARLSYLPPDQVLARPGSIGRGIPGVSLRLVDEAGHTVPAGVTGEIVAHGENVSPGYFADPVGTAAKFPGGDLRTGDLAVADEDGYLYVVDRVDDFIKSWGYRISSQEIEACVLRMPDLVSAAAVGVPDLAAGEAVALVVTARPGSAVTAADVLAFARARLPKHMVPATVRLVDAIPLNANGKVVKTQVRAMVREATEPEGALS